MLAERIETRLLPLEQFSYLMLSWSADPSESDGRLTLDLHDIVGRTYHLKLKADEVRSLVIGLTAIQAHLHSRASGTCPSWSLIARLAGLELSIARVGSDGLGRDGIRISLSKTDGAEALVSVDALEGMEGNLNNTVRAFAAASAALSPPAPMRPTSPSPHP